MILAFLNLFFFLFFMTLLFLILMIVVLEFMTVINILKTNKLSIIFGMIMLFNDYIISDNSMIVLSVVIVTATLLSARVNFFNLDCWVEDLVLISKDRSCFLESCLRLLGSDVSTHRQFTLRDSPNVEIVDFFNFI